MAVEPDFPFMEFIFSPNVVMNSGTDVEAMARRWMADLDFMVQEVPHGVFNQTFHPQTIGRAGRILLLQNVIHRAKHDGAVFSTVHDAVAAWEARSSTITT
jgi:hypothetical protein